MENTLQLPPIFGILISRVGVPPPDNRQAQSLVGFYVLGVVSPVKPTSAHIPSISENNRAAHGFGTGTILKVRDFVGTLLDCSACYGCGLGGDYLRNSIRFGSSHHLAFCFVWCGHPVTCAAARNQETAALRSKRTSSVGASQPQ